MLEKPPLHTIEEIELVNSLLFQNPVPVYVACNLRFHPCIAFLKKTLEKTEKINEVNIYCGSDLRSWRPGKDYKKIYSAIPEQGGGVHLDLFHEFDYATWLFGFPKTIDRFLSSVSSLEIEAADYANYRLIYESFCANVVLNYYRPVPKRTIEIIFDKKCWIADLITCSITDERGNILLEDKNYTVMQTMVAQIEYFVNEVVLRGSDPENNFHHSSKVLNLVQ